MHLNDLLGFAVIESRLVPEGKLYFADHKIFARSYQQLEIYIWAHNARREAERHLRQLVAETNHQLFGDPMPEDDNPVIKTVKQQSGWSYGLAQWSRPDHDILADLKRASGGM